MHEILTLQFGSHSNYIGTHFWNTQEAYFTYAGEEESLVDHDVHFRSGIGTDGSETFTPRVLIYDFKSSFGGLKSASSPYEEPRDNEDTGKLWYRLMFLNFLLRHDTSERDGKTKVQKQPEISKHAYQKYLDEGTGDPGLSVESVRYWSDYNKLFYNPRSMVQLNDNEISGMRPLETWQAGEDLYDNLDRDRETYDQDFRHFVEECDQLQGLQILTTADDAWGGFAAKYADRLRDDFEKSSIWIWAVENTSMQRNAGLWWINLARSLSALPYHASLYTPIVNEPLQNSRDLSIDWHSSWHKSALQATAIETMTLSSRLKRANRNNLVDMEQAINALSNRNVTSLALGIADKAIWEEHELSLDMDLSYNMRYQSMSYFNRLEFFRGQNTDTAAYSNKQSANYQSRVTVLPFPITDSFPCIFGSAQGEKLPLAVRTSLSTSAATGRRLNWILDRVKAVADITEREEICNSLSNMADNYSDSPDFDTVEDDYYSN